MSATIEMALDKGDVNVVAVFEFLSGIGEIEYELEINVNLG